MKRVGRAGETEKGWVSCREVWYQLVALPAQHPHPASVAQVGPGSGDGHAHPSTLVEKSWKRTGMVCLHGVRGRFAGQWQDVVKQNLGERYQPISTSPSLLLLCWCCAWCSLVPSHVVLEAGIAGEESPYTKGKGRQRELPVASLPCSSHRSLAGQLRIRQTKAKVQENLLSTSGCGHGASL